MLFIAALHIDLRVSASLPQFSAACQLFHQPLSLALWALPARLPAPTPLRTLPHVPCELPEPSDGLHRGSLQCGDGGGILRWPPPLVPVNPFCLHTSACNGLGAQSGNTRIEWLICEFAIRKTKSQQRG